jgi:C4-dicarboxylate-specific signal transduction histidine kinase
LSRKGAKSRTHGRKLRLTGTKAKTLVGRTRQPRADLEQQLKACRREFAQAREHLVEALEEQTATSEVLRIISNSPTEIQPVLDAVGENAARLCDANNAVIFRLEDDLLRLVASYGGIPTTSRAREGIPANRDTVIGRAACDRRTIHVHDLAAEDREYPVGSRDAKREGHRTTLATPLLREGTPIGVILIRRMEVRPFYDKQIALLGTFAAQAVIAIENVRLFEAEKQRTLALAHANRVGTMGHLAASIAHEVNQPIAAVVTSAHAALSWLGAQPPDLGEVRQALGGIIEDGNRASDVIGRIRGLINKVPPRHDPLDINQAILDATTLTRSELFRHRIALQIQLAQELPAVQGDRIQLQQVLLNLIINAIEAMSAVDEGPRELLISSASNAVDSVLVGVRDSGPGLTPESFGRLFQAFHTTKRDGMGMGLSICRSIVEAHGGRVWATANAPRGTIFQFTLSTSRESTS